VADAASLSAGTGPADGFRSDINGLRAISIALVIAFHLAPGVAPGGFIGVDVFFVISGYLMTRIILGRLRRGRFRLVDFYLSRLRRIWPALVALCGVLCALGAIGLDPWAGERLMGDLPGVLLFVSNFALGMQSGYFAADLTSNWVLHTWSLAVEWQFYLVYPLVLLVVFSRPALRRRLWVVVAALAVVSFALAMVLWTRSSQWSFYLLPTRAWELLAGALCVPIESRLRLSPARRGLVHAGGLVLIGLGAVFAAPTLGWPSAVALLPVGGAALVIAGALPRTIWAENRAVGLLGRASYSIYLWHWPLIVAMRYLAIPLTAATAAIAVCAMIGAGLASYVLIEQWATGWFFAPRRWRWAGGVAVAAAIGAVAYAGDRSDGFEAARTANLAAPLRAALADDRAASGDWAFPAVCGRLVQQGAIRLCQIGDPAARQVLVIGDSHAEQFAPRYRRAFDGRPGAGLTFLTREGCLPVPGVGNLLRGDVCATWALAAYRWAQAAGFRRVAIMANWSRYFAATPGIPAVSLCLTDAGGDCVATPPTAAAMREAVFARLEGAVARLRGQGVEVVLFGQTPRGQAADPAELYRQEFWSRTLSPSPLQRADVLADAEPVRDRLAQAAAATGAPLVDQLSLLCPLGPCPVVDAGRALYKDGGHFRASATPDERFAYLDPWLAPVAAPPAVPIRLK